MRISVLSAVALCALSCARSEVDQTEQSGLTISLSPNFGRSDADASQSAATRVTSTDFESGDALGLYVVLDGRDLVPSGNAVTNGKMVVGSSGLIAGESSSITYPSRSGSVHFYSYYPYSAVVSDIAAHRFAVGVDQTSLINYKASDFCYGRRMGVSPSATAQSISYSHRMSQLLVNVSAPVSVGSKRVTSVKSGVVYGVQSEVDLNFSTGVVTTADVRVDSVKMYRDATVTTAASGSTTHFTAIVPAQTFVARAGAGGSLMNFLITFDDGSSAYYIYNSTSQVNLVEGAANVFNLVIGDRGAVSLSGEPTVAAWASVTEGGILTQQISNSFTALWRVAIKDYKRVNSVVLGINDPVLGSVRRQVTSGFSLNADNSADKVVFKFDFASDAVGGLTYPYTIDYVEFCEGVDSLRRCSSVIAATVTRRGAYTLGIEADHLVAVTLGDFERWEDMLYGDMTRGVDNDFRVSLIEYPHFADIATLKLRIDGEMFTFNNAGCIVGSNSLVATTKDVRFPDANGRAPYKYPFTVERVELYNSGGALISGGGYPASVAVNRAGLVTMRMYRGIITSTTASVTGYNSSGGLGRPDFGGAVENNPLRLVYCYGAASDQLSCLDVDRVEVVINNQTVVLSGYKALMTGSALAAQSSSPHVNIASGSGSKPTSYPYYISKVTLKKSDGTMLFTSALDVPLKVDWFGEVTIEIMEKMTADIAESLTIGEVRWATGNLVADGKGGARIGAPTDGGLYFQFGSLIGWKGGASGDGTGVCTKADGEFFVGTTFNAADEVAVAPSSFSGIASIGTTWPDHTKNLYYFGDASYATTYASLRDFAGFADGSISASGVGDPCTYYLGGNWRLPSAAEFKTLCNSAANGVTPAAANAEWVTSPAKGMNFNISGTKLFIPAAGSRDPGIYVGLLRGLYATESVFSANQNHYLDFSSTAVYPQGNYFRTPARPARCVQTAPTVPQPPKASDYLEINGLKWAKGNLVAVGNFNAKVGAPADGGLYFQFGSLLGWKGGATGDGAGTSTKTTNGSLYGGATFNAVNEISVTPSSFSGVSAIGTTWPTNASNLYYFGLDSYATPHSKLSDFSGFSNGSLASSGVGDPCAYYLGSPWRQPTAMEWKALANNAENGATPTAANAAWQSSAPIGMYFNNSSVTKLFFPASGCRHDRNGSIHNLNGHSDYRVESVSNATDGYIFTFANTYVHAQNSAFRGGGFPARCVSGVSVQTDPLEWKGVDNKGESKQVVVSVGGVAEWTASFTATAGFTAAPLSGKSGDKITLTWSDNTAEGSPARSASIVFTAKGTSTTHTLLTTQNSAAPDNAVLIDGIWWATGNLVANGANGAKIGAPTDGGLYFIFGSLLGWKGGATGDGTGVCTKADKTFYVGSSFNATNEIAVKPSVFTTIGNIGTTWPDQEGKNLYYFGYSTAPYSTRGQSIRAFAGYATGTLAASGVGDPCRYYLGGTWRLPTAEDYKAMCNNYAGGGAPTSANAVWQASPAGMVFNNNKAEKLFIPASGRRLTDGSVYNVGACGYCWSESVNHATNGYHLYFIGSSVSPQDNFDRRTGMPVRCVQ